MFGDGQSPPRNRGEFCTVPKVESVVEGSSAVVTVDFI